MDVKLTIETVYEPQWQTTCPDCGVADQLEIYAATISCRGMYLTGDGFALADAKDVDTDNERVRCTACNSEWDLEFLALEAPVMPECSSCKLRHPLDQSCPVGFTTDF